MVALTHVRILYFRGVGWHCGRRIGALDQVIGRTAIPILRKNVVPAAKIVGADLMVFGAPEIEQNVNCRKRFKSEAKSVGRQTLKKRLGSGIKQRIVIPTKATEQASRSRRDIFTNIFR